MDIQVYVYSARGIVVRVRTFRTLKAAWAFIARQNSRPGQYAVIHGIAA